MPQLDLPLDSLRGYTGRNPRPADFDQYWKQALEALDEAPPNPVVKPARAIETQAAECFDLWFTGVGGARIHAKYLRPAGATRCPVALQFHGLGASSGDWSDKLAYVSQGFAVAAMDCRGQGGFSEDIGGVQGATLRGHITRGLDDPDPHKLLYRSMFLDTVQLARVTASFDEIDSSRMAAVGRSQGGALALACGALEPRIRRIAAQYPYLCDYQRVWEMDLANGAYEDLRDYFRRHDPLHEREEAVFTRLGYIDCQHLASRITGEVLMLTGLMDAICPPSTQFAAYNKIVAPKQMLIYPDFEHESFPAGNDRIFDFITALKDM